MGGAEDFLDRNVSEERFKRIPAKEIELSELNESMKRVSIMGRVTAVDVDSLTADLDNGEKKLKLEFNSKDLMECLETGKFYRVIGKPFFKNNEPLLLSESCHSMDGLDFLAYRKIREKERDYYD